MNEAYRPDAVDSGEFELSWKDLVKGSGLNDEEVLGQIDFLLTGKKDFG